MVRCFFRLLINYSYSYSVVSVKRMKESTRVLLFFCLSSEESGADLDAQCSTIINIL